MTQNFIKFENQKERIQELIEEPYAVRFSRFFQNVFNTKNKFKCPKCKGDLKMIGTSKNFTGMRCICSECGKIITIYD